MLSYPPPRSLRLCSTVDEVVSAVTALAASATSTAASTAASSASSLAGTAPPDASGITTTAAPLQAAGAIIANTTELASALRQLLVADLAGHLTALASTGSSVAGLNLPLAAGGSRTAARLHAVCTVTNAVAAALNGSDYFAPLRAACSAEQAAQGARVAAVLTKEYYAQQGPFFFFGSLFNTSVMVLPGEAEHGIWRNKFGATYVAA